MDLDAQVLIWLVGLNVLNNTHKAVEEEPNPSNVSSSEAHMSGDNIGDKKIPKLVWRLECNFSPNKNFTILGIRT